MPHKMYIAQKATYDGYLRFNSQDDQAVYYKKKRKKHNFIILKKSLVEINLLTTITFYFSMGILCNILHYKMKTSSAWFNFFHRQNEQRIRISNYHITPHKFLSNLSDPFTLVDDCEADEPLEDDKLSVDQGRPESKTPTGELVSQIELKDETDTDEMITVADSEYVELEQTEANETSISQIDTSEGHDQKNVHLKLRILLRIISLWNSKSVI